MFHLTYGQATAYSICFLVPQIHKDGIQKAYIDPFGIRLEDVLVLSLHMGQGKKKAPVKEMREYIETELKPIFEEQGVQYLVVNDVEYFKLLAKVPKVDANLGYVLDCDFGPWKVVYVPSHKAIFYDPEKTKAKIAQGMDAVVAHMIGSYQAPGQDLIQFAAYPETDEEIEQWLIKLLDMDKPLAIDIEAFSLKHTDAGIGTICFAWDKHNGIAFPVDYVPIADATEAPFGIRVHNQYRRKLLRAFFEQFLQKGIYHNISYDVYVLIYQLFMEDILDTEGLLTGLEIMLRDWDDTKLITYLATNSCSGNKLSLKDQAQEFSGNYAESEIKDITRIPLPKLLRYNLIDGCSTWFVREKHFDTMVKDQQEELYETLFKPIIVDIIQMQLTGMPINMERVAEVKGLLQADEQKARTKIEQSSVIQAYTYHLNEKWVIAKNLKLKKKRVTMADAKETFNPNSAPQVQDLLFNRLGLPVLGLTKSGEPDTKKKTIKDLKFHTDDQNIKDFLDALADYKDVAIILSTFIPAMEGAVLGPDGWHYMFGNFNLGGTISGRLSSSDPNLQNIPATGSRYAAWIKWCFEAPMGWLYVGLDFDSLEDKISTVTTKDPNKIKVYTDGYDGHCLRAYSYFGEQMPDIIDTVESINSIAKKYKPQRQESKAPTFALTYQGTWVTLMKNCGFSEEKAKMVETRYHHLYEVSDQWVAKKLDQATVDGYVTIAFGLRLRTPLLKQVVRGNSKTPYEAEAEGRTAGNALGQSWCLLNSRAWVEFMQKVRASEFRTMIRPCAQIHDAGYALVKDDIAALMFTNKHLSQAVRWQEHPDIQDDQVKLSGAVDIFYPNWDKSVTIPNDATEEQIFRLIDDHMEKLSA